MRKFSIEEKLEKKLVKISKKDKLMYESVLKKIDEIINCSDVNHYKNLRKPMQFLKRVHVKSSFVLIFQYLEKEDKILFFDLDHHDNIYK